MTSGWLYHISHSPQPIAHSPFSFLSLFHTSTARSSRNQHNLPCPHLASTSLEHKSEQNSRAAPDTFLNPSVMTVRRPRSPHALSATLSHLAHCIGRFGSSHVACSLLMLYNMWPASSWMWLLEIFDLRSKDYQGFLAEAATSLDYPKCCARKPLDNPRCWGLQLLVSGGNVSVRL